MKITKEQRKIIDKYVKDNNIIDRAMGYNGFEMLDYLDQVRIWEDICQYIPEIKNLTYCSFWSYYIDKVYLKNCPEKHTQRKLNDTKAIADKMAEYIREVYNDSNTIDKLICFMYDTPDKIQWLFNRFDLVFNCHANLGHIRQKIESVVDYINKNYDIYKLNLEIIGGVDRKVGNAGRTLKIGTKIRVIKCEPIVDNIDNVDNKDNMDNMDNIDYMITSRKYNGRETIADQIQRLKNLLEKYDGKTYKKEIDKFRVDMEFGDRFRDKHQLKHHILKLIEEIKLDKKFIINEPIFDFTDNTITLYAEIIKPDIEKEMEQEQKELQEKIEKEAPKLSQYEYGVAYTLKCKARFGFGKDLFRYCGSHIVKAYTETEADQLAKKYIEEEIKRYTVKGNKQIDYEYSFNSKTPIEPYK